MNKYLMNNVKKTIASDGGIERDYCGEKESQEYKKLMSENLPLPKGVKIEKNSDNDCEGKFFKEIDISTWTDEEIDRALNLINIENIKKIDKNISFIKWFLILTLVVPIIIGILIVFIF